LLLNISTVTFQNLLLSTSGCLCPTSFKFGLIKWFKALTQVINQYSTIPVTHANVCRDNWQICIRPSAQYNTFNLAINTWLGHINKQYCYGLQTFSQYFLFLSMMHIMDMAYCIKKIKEKERKKWKKSKIFTHFLIYIFLHCLK
jgi:hypothetical protein